MDFCFPFIRKSTLFTDVLINICHEHKVELSILCDKSDERVHEVCSLSDNVLCIRREEKDIDSIEISVERFVEQPYPSSIIRYKIKSVQNLFNCNSDGALDIDGDQIDYELIGSMKEYWRQTSNVIEQTRNAHNDESDNMSD